MQNTLFEKKKTTEKERNAVYHAHLTSTIRHLNSAVKSRELGGAHSKALATIFNFLKEKGAVSFEKERFKFIASKIPKTVEELSKKILEIQGEANYDKAKQFFIKYAVLPKDFETSANKLKLPRAVISPLPKIKRK
ncbi:MAG: hypothetical protein ACE5DI_02300 [Candidatus Micrarchaeia archaeon]